MALRSISNTRLGILCILIGVFTISINDMLIKALSGGYPLHQLVFVRSSIGICFTLVIVHFEGGFGNFRGSRPGLQIMRGLLIFVANVTYFIALAALPLADTTALFFVAPLMITLLSIPLLGERVGPMRLGAVAVGFIGVLIMQRIWESSATLEVHRLVLLLPVVAAFTYALNQVLTRKLGAVSKAGVLAAYIQATFIIVSLAFYFAVGDGRFAVGSDNPSIQFLFRAWIWPARDDWWILIFLGVNSAAVGYTLSQAYRLADAATIAPYEYVGLPLAVFWGLVIFGDLPTWEVWTGIILILGAGLFVWLREQQKARAAP